MAKHANKIQILFTGLVQNALDFFEKSISEATTSPKYSIIHFCSAIELLLKARLFREHWSLINEDPGRARLSSMMSGNFRTVGISEALSRLECIAGENFRSDETKCFERIRGHRNKLIHFDHPINLGKARSGEVQRTVLELFYGWFYLHRLVAGRWKESFSDFQRDVERLQKRLYRKRGFLKIRYQTLAHALEKEAKKGVQFHKCFICRFPANREKKIFGPLVEFSCLVCGDQTERIKIDCPECERTDYLAESEEKKCRKCKTKIGIDELIQAYGDSGSPKESPENAYCSSCISSEATAVLIEKKWLCLACFEIFESADRCEWCTDLVTGELEASYAFGCGRCDGKIADED